MAKPNPRRAIFRLSAVALLFFIVVSVLKLMAPRPNHLGVKDGRLAPCPASPNCVSTQADNDAHRIEPLRFTGSPSLALFRLKTVLSRQPRMKIVAETDNYLHVEATSLVFRFVDDVEFLIDEKAGVIHFRSASRIGYSDLGANRARMERIRAAWNDSETAGDQRPR